MTMPQEFNIITAILSAKEDSTLLISFKNRINDFYELTKKIAVKNERDLLLRLESIENEMSIVSAYPQLFTKHVIAVGGGFSAGKSQFINSFFRDTNNLSLPTQMDPTTAIPSYVIHEKENKILGITNKNGIVDFTNIAPNILNQLTHNADDRLDFQFNIKEILPFMIVGTEFSDDKYSNICFIDTPGYNPDSSNNKADDISTAKEFLSNSSALLWLVATDASSGNLTQSDLDFLQDLNLENKKLYIVINKADLRSQEDLESVLENVKDTLEMEGIDFEGISLYSSVNVEEYGFEKKSLIEFIEEQNGNKHSKSQENLMQNLIEIYKEYQKVLLKRKSDNDEIISVLSTVNLTLLCVPDEPSISNDIQESLRYVKNLDKLFSVSYSKEINELIERLEKSFIELKNSIDEVFGVSYPYNVKSDRITNAMIKKIGLRTGELMI